MVDNSIIVNSIDEFNQIACLKIFEKYKESIKSRDFFSLVLSGGNTPKGIFKELVKNYLTRIRWDKVHFFWLDERCVEPYHIESNYNLAYSHLISQVGVVGSIHRMKGELDPVKSAIEYEQDIKSFFKNSSIQFDFILMGMGKDGHVASLFPNDNLDDLSELVVYSRQKHNGYYRISLNFDIINRCRYSLLLINNEKKNKIIKTNDPKYPINRISNKEKLCLLK